MIIALLAVLPQAWGVDYSTWMNDHKAIIGDFKLRDLLILGTHDAGSYDPLSPVDFGDPRWDELEVGDHFPPDDFDDWRKQVFALGDELYEPWSQNHERTIYQQLNDGIRSIDLRVAVDDGGTMRFAHGLYNDTIEKNLDDAKRFHDENPNEILIIWFQKFYDSYLDDQPGDYTDGMRGSKHEELETMINDRFSGDIAEFTNFNGASKVKDFINAGKTVIIAYHAASAGTWSRPSSFWPGHSGYGRGTNHSDSHHRQPYYDGLIAAMQGTPYLSDEDNLFTFGNVTHNSTLIANGTLTFGSYPGSIESVARDANPVLLHWLVTELADPPPAGANYRYKARPNVIGVDYYNQSDVVDVCLELNGINTNTGVLTTYATEPDSPWNEGWKSGPEIALEWSEQALSDAGDWFEDTGDQIADWFEGAGEDFVEFFEDLFSDPEPAPPSLRTNFIIGRNGAPPSGQIPTGVRHYQVQIEWIKGGSSANGYPVQSVQFYSPDFQLLPDSIGFDDLSWLHKKPIGYLNPGANHFFFDSDMAQNHQWYPPAMIKDFYISDDYFPSSASPVLYFTSEYLTSSASWIASTYDFMYLPSAIGETWESTTAELSNGSQLKYRVTRLRAGEPREIPQIVWEPREVYSEQRLENALNARTEPSVPGTFTYARVDGNTVLPDGEHELLVQFVPQDTENYASVTKTVTIEIGPKPLIEPVITWNPSSLVTNLEFWPFGQATAKVNGVTVPGTFTYTPALGDYPESALHGETPLRYRVALFTPDDPTTYAEAYDIAEYRMNLEQKPYSGTPIDLPGLISPGYHDQGGWLIAYSKRYGYSEVDWLQEFSTDEWVEYTVNVAHSGTFNVTVKAQAWPSSGDPTFRLSRAEGQIVLTDSHPVPAYLSDIHITDVYLPRGVHVLRLENTSPHAVGRMTARSMRFDRASYDPEDVTAPGDAITASSSNSPEGEEVDKIIDDTHETKHLNFDKQGAGFTVTPSYEWTRVGAIALTSGNDEPARDPSRVRVEGSVDGIQFVVLAEMDIPPFTQRLERQEIPFTNTTSYKSYRITFPEVADAAAANAVQVSEVELIGTPSDPRPMLRFLGAHEFEVDTTVPEVTVTFWLENTGEQTATVTGFQDFGKPAQTSWNGGEIPSGERQKVDLTVASQHIEILYSLKVESDSAGPNLSVYLSALEENISSEQDYALGEIVANAMDGETVRFGQYLNGKTISFFRAPISIDKAITIDASNLSEGVTFVRYLTETGQRHFHIEPNGHLTLRGINLTGGNVGNDFGGAILNEGRLTIEDSALFGNQAARGGAIYSPGASEVTLRNVTFSRNVSHGTTGGAVDLPSSLSTCLIESCTFSGNEAATYGGGVHAKGMITVRHSILAGNTAGTSGPDYFGIVQFEDQNLLGGDAQLAPLGFYGGPTLTMPPYGGSPAVDAVVTGTVPVLDQRRFPRVGPADLGAAEVQGIAISGSFELGPETMTVALEGCPTMSYMLASSTDLQGYTPLPESFLRAESLNESWETTWSQNRGFVRAQRVSGLTQGLRAYWGFENSALNSKFALGDMNQTKPLHAVAEGDEAYTSDMSGSAAWFDGVGDYYSVDGQIVPPGAPFTVSAWFKAVDVPSGTERQMIYETSPNYTISLGLREGAEDTSMTMVQFHTYDGSAIHVEKEFPDAEIQGQWIHTLMTYDGSRFRFYVNGNSLVWTRPSDGWITNFIPIQGTLADYDSFHIGTHRDANGRWFHGSIDEVSVWNRVLTHAEHVYLYNDGRPVSGIR